MNQQVKDSEKGSSIQLVLLFGDVDQLLLISLKTLSWYEFFGPVRRPAPSFVIFWGQVIRNMTNAYLTKLTSRHSNNV